MAINNPTPPLTIVPPNPNEKPTIEKITIENTFGFEKRKPEFIEQIRTSLKAYQEVKNCKFFRPPLEYFNHDHHSRYIDGWSLIARNIAPTKGMKCMEAGSPFPFFTYPFMRLLDWECMTFGLETINGYIMPDVKCYIKYGNLCTDDWCVNRYDLIVCTEALEHTPCSMVKTKDRLIASLKKGGYLLMSFPLGGMEAKGYEIDRIPLDKMYELGIGDRVGEPHIREFTKETARNFIVEPQMKCLEEIISHPIAYAHIMQRLYIKE